MGRPGPRSPEVLAARTSPNQLFSEVIYLRLQSVELLRRDAGVEDAGKGTALSCYFT